MFADLHCDTVTRSCDEGKGLRENDLHLDFIRRQKAGGGIQNFALFLDQRNLKGEDIMEKTKKYLSFYNQQVKENADIVVEVNHFRDIKKCLDQGKLAAVLTLEEGAVCKGTIDNLGYYYDNGVRMMTMTWNYDNELAASCATQADYGLTRKGREFVEEMERLGMIVDVSHLSDKGIRELCGCATKPFVASHSNARSICSHRRNLTDDMICGIAEKGGVIGINFYEHFLCSDFARLDVIEQRNVLAAHVKHIISVGGEECVAIGSDFDGIDTNPLLPDVTVIPKMREMLHFEGISERVLDKMYMENAMRVYGEL